MICREAKKRDNDLFLSYFISISHFITLALKFYFNFLGFEQAGNFAGKVFEYAGESMRIILSGPVSFQYCLFK